MVVIGVIGVIRKVIPQLGRSITGPNNIPFVAKVSCERKEKDHKNESQCAFKSNNFHQNLTSPLKDAQRKSILTSKKAFITNKDKKLQHTRCALLAYNNDDKQFQGPLWLRDNWDQFVDNVSTYGINETRSVVEILSSFYGFLKSNLANEVNLPSVIMGFEPKPIPNSCMIVVDNEKLVIEGDAGVVVVVIGDFGIDYISQDDSKKYSLKRDSKGIQRVIMAPLSLYGLLKSNEDVMVDPLHRCEEDLENELKNCCKSEDNSANGSGPVASDGLLVLFR